MNYNIVYNKLYVSVKDNILTIMISYWITEKSLP